MEMELASYQSRFGFWSGRAWKTDCCKTMSLPPDRYNGNPVAMDDEDADVEMLDLNAQIHDTPTPAVSSNSTSTSIYADPQWMSMAPSTALENGTDESNAILDEMASLSIDAIEKPSDDQNAAVAAVRTPKMLQIKPRTVSKCRRLPTKQCHRTRQASSRVTHSVSCYVHPALLASELRAQPSSSNTEAWGPTTTHKCGRESFASGRRRWGATGTYPRPSKSRNRNLFYTATYG